MSYAHQATGRFTVTSWSEHLLVDIDGTGTTSGDAYYPSRGMTRADVGYSYTGDIEGTGTLTYLIAYKADAAPVLCFEYFEGSIHGQRGSCVFQHIGEQDAEAVTAHMTTVPGMGTGGLENLRGAATLSIAGHSDDGYELVLSYDLT